MSTASVLSRKARKADVWRLGIVSEEGFVENRGHRLIPLSTDSFLKTIDLVVKDPIKGAILGTGSGLKAKDIHTYIFLRSSSTFPEMTSPLIERWDYVCLTVTRDQKSENRFVFV